MEGKAWGCSDTQLIPSSQSDRMTVSNKSKPPEESSSCLFHHCMGAAVNQVTDDSDSDDSGVVEVHADVPSLLAICDKYKYRYIGIL